MARWHFIVVCLALGLMMSLWLRPSMAADRAVVISSSLPELAPGTILEEEKSLSLPSGASAVLLFRSGEMLRLNGPFEGKPTGMIRADGAEGSVGELVGLLRAQGASASVIGATRGWPTPQRPRSGDDVTVGLDRSGIYCLQPGDTVWLTGQRGGKASIRLRRGRSVRELPWPPNASRIEWPSDLPIEDSDIFEALDPSGAPTASMIFRRVKPAPSASASIAERILVGCREQAEPELRELIHSVGDTTRR
jgi:hypothetical protein